MKNRKGISPFVPNCLYKLITAVCDIFGSDRSSVSYYVRLSVLAQIFKRSSKLSPSSLVQPSLSLREASIKKKKKLEIFPALIWPPNPPLKKTMYFFSEIRTLLGHFLKTSVFSPLKCQIHSWKWLSIGTLLFFSHKIFLPKWLRMA